jgi:hypothetical protein
LIPAGSSRVQWARWELNVLCDLLVDYICNKSFGKLRSSVQPREASWGCADRLRKTKSGPWELVRLSFGWWAVQIISPQQQVYKTLKKNSAITAPLCGKRPSRSSACPRVRFRTIEFILPGSLRVQWARWVPYFLCDFLVNYISNKSFGKVRSSVQPEERLLGWRRSF